MANTKPAFTFGGDNAFLLRRIEEAKESATQSFTFAKAVHPKHDFQGSRRMPGMSVEGSKGQSSHHPTAEQATAEDRNAPRSSQPDVTMQDVNADPEPPKPQPHHPRSPRPVDHDDIGDDAHEPQADQEPPEVQEGVVLQSTEVNGDAEVHHSDQMEVSKLDRAHSASPSPARHDDTVEDHDTALEEAGYYVKEAEHHVNGHEAAPASPRVDEDNAITARFKTRGRKGRHAEHDPIDAPTSGQRFQREVEVSALEGHDKGHAGQDDDTQGPLREKVDHVQVDGDVVTEPSIAAPLDVDGMHDDHQPEQERAITRSPPKQKGRHVTVLNPVDGNKVHRQKVKSKSRPNGPLPPAELRSHDILRYYQRTVDEEHFTVVQHMTEQLHEKESVIESLKKQNDDLSENLTACENAHDTLCARFKEKEKLLVLYSSKMHKFANYMSSLDKDFPILANEQKVINKRLTNLLDVKREEIRQGITEAQMTVNRIQIEYQNQVRSAQSEISSAHEYADELRKQLQDSAGQLAEERDRSQRFEKQLKAAADSKDEIMQELQKFQTQFAALESAVGTSIKQGLEEHQVAAKVDEMFQHLATLTTSEHFQNELGKLSDTISELHTSHASRLEEFGKSQAALFSSEIPMEIRLNEAIAHLAQAFGDTQRLQQRNGELSALNAKLEQQVNDQHSQFASLAKEKDALAVNRIVLEERLQRTKEDLAVAHERWMKAPAATEDMSHAQQAHFQVALLQNENASLKNELKQNREEGEQFGSDRLQLLSKVEELKKQVQDSNARYEELKKEHAMAMKQAKENLAAEIAKAKKEAKENAQAFVQSQNMEIKNKLLELRNAKEALGKDLEQATTALNNANGRLASQDKHETDMQHLRKVNGDLCQREENANKELSALRKAQENLQVEHAKTRKQNQEDKTAIKEHNKEIARLNGELATAESVRSSLQDRVDAVQQDFDAQVASVQQFEVQRSNWQEEREDLKKQIEAAGATAEKERLAAQTAKEELVTVRRSNKDEVGKLKQELSTLRGQFDDVVAQLSSLKEANKQVATREAATQVNNRTSDSQYGASSQRSSNTINPSQLSQRQVQVIDSQLFGSQRPPSHDDMLDLDDLAATYTQLAPGVRAGVRIVVPETQLGADRPMTFTQIAEVRRSSPLSEPRDIETPSSIARGRASLSNIEDVDYHSIFPSTQELLISRDTQPPGRSSQDQSSGRTKVASNTASKITHSTRPPTPVGRQSQTNVHFEDDTQSPSSSPSWTTNSAQRTTKQQRQKSYASQSSNSQVSHHGSQASQDAEFVPPAPRTNLKRKSTSTDGTSTAKRSKTVQGLATPASSKTARASGSQSASSTASRSSTEARMATPSSSSKSGKSGKSSQSRTQSHIRSSHGLETPTSRGSSSRVTRTTSGSQ